MVCLILAHYKAFDSRYKGTLPLKQMYVPQGVLGASQTWQASENLSGLENDIKVYDDTSGLDYCGAGRPRRHGR